MREGLGRVASPALGLVSAWFLIRTLEEKSRAYVFKSRTITLMVPYIFWNVVALLFFMGIFLVFQRDDVGLQGRPFFILLWDKVFDPFTWPLNGPLHYYRDLLILALSYSLVHQYVKGKTIFLFMLTIMSPVLLVMLGKSGDWLGDNMHSLLPRVDLTFYFLLGISTANSFQNIFRRKIVDFLIHPITLICLLIAGIFCSHIMYYQTEIASLEANFANVSLLYVTLILRALLSLFVFCLVLVLYKYFRLSMDRKAIARIFCSHIMFAYLLYGALNDIISQDYRLFLLLGVFCGVIILGVLVHLIFEFLTKLPGGKIFKYF